MATIKIKDFPEATTINDTDIIVVETPTATNKMTGANLTNFINEKSINNTFIRHSANSDGSDFVEIPTSITVYTGIYTGTSATAPTDKTAYTWSKFVGESGSGTGDMLKATYDTDNDGIVNNSEKLGGNSPSFFSAISANETYTGAKAFAKGLIAYGKSATALPTGLGAYVTAYVDTTHGARLLSYDGAAYQPLKIGSVVDTDDSVFSLNLNADGTIGIGSSLKRWDGSAWVSDKLTFTSVSVATNAWATYTATLTGEADLTTAGYIYKAKIPCTGVTTNHIPIVTYGAVESDDSNYSAQAITEAGYVDVYAKAIPSVDITILTIDCAYKGV